MKKISFIVAAYNVENYIERCLDSILNQKYNHEIIVVNDDSADETLRILKKYESRIKLVCNKQNEGLSFTRNIGVKHATGDYIWFIDGDDFIENNILAKLDEHLNQDYDVLGFKAQRVWDSGKKVEINLPVFDGLSGEKALEIYILNKVTFETSWAYAYKREFWVENNFQFAIGLFHEDYGLTPLVLLKAKTVKALDFIAYNYYQSNNNSIMRSNDYEKAKKKHFDRLAHAEYYCRILKGYKINSQLKSVFGLFIIWPLLKNLKELNQEDQRRFLKRFRQKGIHRLIPASNLKNIIKRNILLLNPKIFIKAMGLND